MLGIQYYKADPSTYVIRSTRGKAVANGAGLSFFYNRATTSIAAIPISTQEAPFIFNLQSKDFQAITVQGQLTYRCVEPAKTAELFNFTLANDGVSYLSEDPLNLNDRVIRAAQTIVQARVQALTLRESLQVGETLVAAVRGELGRNPEDGPSPLADLGLHLLDVSIGNVAPTPETARALEAQAREAILQEADDAIYSRRKSAVEQERTIKDAELQTELSVQQKEQEIEALRVENEREIFRGKTATEREKLAARIEAESQRKNLVAIKVENSNVEADAESYAITARMKAFQALPVEHIKAMALAQMQPDQLMAVAFESLAANANKIGELNIGPDMFNQSIRQAMRKGKST